MKSLITAAIALGSLTLGIRAQVELSNFPISINAENYDYLDGVAFAEGNVFIEYKNVAIYSDKAQYNQVSNDVMAQGNVVLYRDGKVYKGDRAVYNLDSEKITAFTFRGFFEPVFYEASEFSSASVDLLETEATILTSHDSANPNYRLKAKSIDIYPNDRIVFRNLVFYAGKVPIMWLPYLSQPFDDELGYSFTPGYNSPWGGFLLNKYGVLWGDHTLATFKLDLRTSRGVGGGLDLLSLQHRDNDNFGLLRTYYAYDTSTDTNFTSAERDTGIDENRYRVNLQHRIYVSDSFYLDFDINKLSDKYIYLDFFPNEFQVDPQPDNNINLVYENDRVAANLIAREQLNEFFRSDTRLPEIAVEFPRQPIAASLFYEGETSAGIYREKFGEDERFFADAFSGEVILKEDPRFNDPDYELIVVKPQGQGFVDQKGNPIVTANDELVTSPDQLDELGAFVELGIEETFQDTQFNRVDTYHQLTYPIRLAGGGVNIIPRAGYRGTYYSDPTNFDGTTFGDEFRSLFHAGIDFGLKFSRVYSGVDSRALGLNQIRHIFQPYTNYSFVAGDSLPLGYPQIDRLVRTTRQRPLDMPLFTAIDGINEWSILRVGMHNRFQTLRNGRAFNWLTINTYVDAYFEDPEFDRDFSNLYNEITWFPLPWLLFRFDSQIPVFGDDSDFYELRTRFTFMPIDSLEFTIGHLYLKDNPFFEDSNLVDLYAYARLGDNWGVSLFQRYEAEDSTLEVQQYSLYRDLTSWTASLGALIRDNRGEDEYGFVLTFTLKDFPQVSLPFNLDPQGYGQN